MIKNLQVYILMIVALILINLLILTISLIPSIRSRVKKLVD